MRFHKGWVRLASSSLMTAALVAPGTLPAPSAAAAASNADEMGVRNAGTPASSAEDCEFMLRFGRGRWSDDVTQAVPVQMRLLCEGPLAALELTHNGKRIPADVGVRGGSAVVTSAVALTVGQPGGNLCLTATLMGETAEEVSHCIAMPDAQPPAAPRQAAPAPEEQPQPVTPTARAEQPAPPSTLQRDDAPAAAGGGMSVLESGGRPLDAVEAQSSERPPVRRSGPDTSLKLPDGHTWGLNDAAATASEPRIADPVDNAIARALRNSAARQQAAVSPSRTAEAKPAPISGPAPSEPMPNERALAPSAPPAPQTRPALKGIEILEAGGAPLDANEPVTRPAPQRAELPQRPRAETPAGDAAAAAPPDGATGRARPSHITEEPVIAAEGRIIESRLDRMVWDRRNEADIVIKRAIRPAAPPAMPKVLVKAGDETPAGHPSLLAALGLVITSAGYLLRRKARPTS